MQTRPAVRGSVLRHYDGTATTLAAMHLRTSPVRNLMGRLNARTDEELQRISIAWLVPGTARDRAALIAQLMRTMLDLRAARDFWVRRPHDEREMIALFVANGSEEGMTIAELAEALDRDESDTRAIATRLYQAGVLASSARQQSLAVGEQPRLFLPRELGQLFARIQDELDAGDISQATPAALLQLLDDADIQRAAELWGLEPMPGLRTRRELTEGLLEMASYPDRRAAAQRKLGWDARRILAKVEERLPGQAIDLAEVAEALELDPDHLRTAGRLREALSELEEALLVWHTFTSDGKRALFQPIWQVAAAKAERDQQAPAPVDLSPDRLEALSADALAWDLLTLLRWLGAGTPVVASLASATNRSRRRLNQLLWNRGTEEPLPGYLEFLAALAEDENLLIPPDAENGVNRALRTWRNRSFAEQMDQLLSAWLGASTWIEAMDQEEVVVSGANWPQFRRRMLVLLPELDPDRWYRLEEIARWLGRRSAESLGEAVQIATARPVDPSLDRSSERLSSLEQVVERTLRGAFTWFGFVQMGHIPTVGEVVRPTVPGLVAAGALANETPAEIEGAAIVVHPDLTVTLRAPSPVRVWSLTAFADQVRLQPQVDYRITSNSLKRALTAGFRVEDVVTFLERQSGASLELAASAQLAAWSESLGRVWMSAALVLHVENDDETRALRPLLEAAGLRVTPHGSALLVEGTEGMPGDVLTARVEELLRQAGKTPQFRPLPDSMVLGSDAPGGREA